MKTTAVQDVEKKVCEYFAALNRKDLESLIQLFTPDATLMITEAESAIGSEAVERAYQRDLRCSTTTESSTSTRR